MNDDMYLSEIKTILADALAMMAGEPREAKAEYAAFIAEISPQIGRYAAAAAAGEPRAADTLRHLVAQAEAKAAVMQIAVTSASQQALGQVITVIGLAAARWLMKI